MLRTSIVACLLLCSAVLASCGSNEPQVEVEPFQVAIVEYLKAGNMGMAVYEFKEISVDGDAATAKVSLHAAEVPQVKVRWEFVFEQRDGAWRVISHKE